MPLELGLRDLRIQAEYRSDHCDLIRDFYVPCLSRAARYDRAVGFFSSTSMAAVAAGLTAFICSAGKMRLVVSPCLSSEDVEAIRQGLQKREEIVGNALSKALEEELSEVVWNRLACLAWLLEKGILEIRVAVPRQIRQFQGIYHEKLGIFADSEENLVTFMGSANESSTALIDNFECIDVYASWEAGVQKRAIRKAQNFERLWENETAKIEVMPFPEAAAKSLLRFKPSVAPTLEDEWAWERKARERAGEWRADQRDREGRVEDREPKQKQSKREIIPIVYNTHESWPSTPEGLTLRGY
ncbi:MAG: hypothetical protein AAGF01_20580, partial [Cyanobacteria bacterium P01_G01_bin.38]